MCRCPSGLRKWPVPYFWVPDVQVSNRSAEDTHPRLRCLTQLALSLLVSQLSPQHWYMAWNGVSTIYNHATFNRPFS